MITLTDLCKTYKVGSTETSALVGLSLDIKKGDFITVTGKSGCGKSTLLNTLGLMDNYDSGRYLFNDKDISKLNKTQRANFRNKTIGFVFQSFNLIDDLTVLENIEIPMGYAGISSSIRKSKALQLLESVGVSHKSKNFPRHLSGGEQQRVAIARALANTPDIILADEPTGNLDEKNGQDIMGILVDLHKKGSTIVMVTHDPVLAEFGERTIKMRDGKIIDKY